MTSENSPRIVEIALTKELQSEFTSYLDCCYSLGVSPNIRAFLFYYYNYEQ